MGLKFIMHDTLTSMYRLLLRLCTEINIYRKWPRQHCKLLYVQIIWHSFHWAFRILPSSLCSSVWLHQLLNRLNRLNRCRCSDMRQYVVKRDVIIVLHRRHDRRQFTVRT